MDYKVDIFTGIRPSASLTIANYLGAVAPIIKLQSEVSSLVVFVADLHGITDQEPQLVRRFASEIVADYLALGIDPQKAKIYLQSDIGKEVALMTLFLSRLVSASELLRVPTLKDKLKKGAQPETTNTLLLLYPVMMAADILLLRAKRVPVGEDQLPHIELTRFLARKFNKKYSPVFPLPQALEVKTLRVLSLIDEGKMSKSHPQGAIFLTDSPNIITKKVKRAETGFEGEMNEKIKNLVLIGKGLAKSEKEKEEIDKIIKEHKAGKKVMGKFKELILEIILDFTRNFQKKRREILKDPSYLQNLLQQGREFAKEVASETLKETKRAMGF